MEATTVAYRIWHSRECCGVSVFAHVPLLVMGNADTTVHLPFYHHCMIYVWGVIWNIREDKK